MVLIFTFWKWPVNSNTESQLGLGLVELSDYSVESKSLFVLVVSAGEECGESTVGVELGQVVLGGVVGDLGG